MKESLGTWGWSSLIAEIIVVLLLLAFARLETPAPLNQSKAFYGHTSDGYHSPWLLKLKSGNDQTVKRRIK